MLGSNKSKIRFFSNDVRIGLRNTGPLKKFIESIFKKQKKALATLNYIFCTDEFVLEINKKYLGHNYYTDVITFDLSPRKKEIHGEVYISLQRVKSNATGMGVSQASELHRVIFHAALHLCGYKDKTPRQIAIIRKREDGLLRAYFKK